MTVFLKLLGALSIIPSLLCQECGNDVDIRPPTETFYSPTDSKGLYGNDWKCRWKVSVNESSRINLWFTAFEFDKIFWGNCNDYLEMWDGSNRNAPKLFKSCEESLDAFKAIHDQNAEFNSSGNTLFLKMTTDGRSPRREGFSATFRSIPEPATTTATVVTTTSSDEESTLLQRTTVDTESTTRVEDSATTPSSLFSLSTTEQSKPTILTCTFKSIPTDLLITIPVNPSTTSNSNSSEIPSLQPSPSSSSSLRLYIVVPTVSVAFVLTCIFVTGFCICKRSSTGKSKTSPNNHSIHGVGTNPVTAVKEQSEPYSTTLYYNNESFHASPEGLYHPPPYQSKNDVDMRSSRMNTRILPSEGVIGNVAYESFDGEEKRNSDYSANAGNIVNIAYESYDEEDIADNIDNTANVGEVGNIAYESYGGQENVDNGDYTANVGEVSNIAYQSYDGQGKVENDDNVLHEGETSNVVYESYDRQENSGNSDDAANRGEVSNDAYENYDGENNVTDDTDEVSREYQTIDDSQSVDDDYSNIRC